MKAIRILCVGMAMTGCALLKAQTPAVEPEIENYLLEFLNTGTSATLPPDRKLAASQIEAEQKSIWAAWKAALARHKGEKLIPLADWQQADTGRWHIPEALEPHASMPYYYGYKGSRPAEGYPLFIYLHGSGPKDREWATGWQLARIFDDAPSVYFVPQIPNEGEYYRWGQPGKQYLYTRLLQQTLASGDIDPYRVYLIGISEGAYGSQRMAAFYADYLAGAGPMAGGEPQPNAPGENLANIAFSLTTGANDMGFYRNILTQYTGFVLDSLQRLHPGYYSHHSVNLIPGKGHAIDYRPTTPYLKQYKRNPYPHYVSWENFEMYGPRRTGFYNLRLPEGANKGEARLRYEMTIGDKNDVHLRVDTVHYTVTQRDPNWGIVLKVKKDFAVSPTGHLQVFLNDSLVDLRRPVTISVNGRRVFRGKVRPSLHAMLLSVQEYFDPLRIYPAMVDVKW